MAGSFSAQCYIFFLLRLLESPSWAQSPNFQLRAINFTNCEVISDNNFLKHDLLSLNAHSLLDNNPGVTTGGNLCPSNQRSASIRSPQHTFTHSWCDYFNHHDLLQLQRKNNFVCPKF